MIFSKHTRTVLIIALALASGAPEAFAGSAGTGIYGFLKADPSPKSAAVGGSSNFISAQSMYTNPAVLPWIRTRELSVEQLSHLLNSNFSVANYSHPLSGGRALGFSLGYNGVGGLIRTVADTTSEGYTEKGEFEYYDILASAAYGQKMTDKFSWGVSLKGVHESIDGNRSSGVMISAGGFFNPEKLGYSWGFGIVNLGPQVKGYSLPAGAFLGFSNRVGKSVKWTGQGALYNDGLTELNTGLEIAVRKLFLLRGGYRYPLKDNGLGSQSTLNFSGGVGFALKSFEFDYAWVPYGDLGDTNRVSLTMKF